MVANLTVCIAMVLRCVGEENEVDSGLAIHIHSVNTRKRNRKADPLRSFATTFDGSASVEDNVGTTETATTHAIRLEPKSTAANIEFAGDHSKPHMGSGVDESSMAKAAYIV